MNKYIKKTEDYVKSVLDKDGSGHDWYHIDRVRKIAKEIAKKEKADPLVIELGALLTGRGHTPLWHRKYITRRL